MAKRVIIKPGDIFYITIKGKYRRYFQYIVKDRTCLNAGLIRVFTKRYELKNNQTVDEILNDRVAFYTHAIISIGIMDRYWEKYGKGPLPSESEWNNILFGYIGEESYVIYTVNRDFIRGVRSPKEKMEDGGLSSCDGVRDRIETGVDIYFMRNHPRESRLRFYQTPFPDAEIYVFKEEKRWSLFQSARQIYHYYKFHGDNIAEEIVVSEGRNIILTRETPSQFGFKLTTKKLSDVDWDDTVPECEYEAARRGLCIDYLKMREDISSRIKNMIMDHYFLSVDLPKFTCGKLYVNIIPRGFRLYLEIVRRKNKEPIKTDDMDVYIPMQTVEFVRWVSFIARAARADYRKQIGFKECSFVEVYMDIGQIGVYRDFLAEGYEF